MGQPIFSGAEHLWPLVILAAETVLSALPVQLCVYVCVVSATAAAAFRNFGCWVRLCHGGKGTKPVCHLSRPCTIAMMLYTVIVYPNVTLS